MVVVVDRASLDLSTVVSLTCRKKQTYSDPDELKRRVDAFMLEFDAREAELKRKLKEKVIDEDGFELVQPSATNTFTSDSEHSRKKRKSSSEGLNDFYKFQMKERKMAEWGDIKKQEVLDKSRLEDMKAQKKFQL